ncbi:MAG TPA: ABC transporter permease [Candidatus Acidoferrales bacterium]|nr:ABC transporter permease [Candidatus Acidoferrales bacterium]
MFSRLRVLASRVRGFFSGHRLDEDFQRELASHFDMLTEENIRCGLPPDEARRQARLRLGGAAQLRETQHDLRGLPWLETLFQDVRFGLRMLRKNPGFLAVCVAALAFGIGVNTAMFSGLYAVVLKPFPFPQPNRIVVGWKADPARGTNDAERGLIELSYLDWKDWRSQSKSFEDMAAMPTTSNGYSYTITGKGEPKQIESSRVTANYFSVLGVTPLLGRSFKPQDDHLGANPVVVLTYQFWRTQFAANPRVIGAGLALDGTAFTIIGVLPRQFVFPQGVDVFTLLTTGDRDQASARWILESRGAVFLQIVGRLKPGVSLKAANTELNTIVARVAAQNPETKGEGQIAALQTLPDYITGTNKTLIYLLFSGSVILLLVASINLASLLATRVVGRSAEIAVRVALGAGKKRLLRQFLTEGLILSGIGAAAGIAVAFLLVRVIAHLAPPQIPRLASVSINGWALSFSIACLILTALLFGLTPLVLIREHGLQTVIRDGSSSISGSVRGRRVGRVFLMAEISATLALVVLTGTFAKSFRNLQNVNLGYKPDHVFTCAVFLNPIRYSNVLARRRFFEDLMERLQSRPEVIAAGALVLRPLEGLVGWYSDYILPDQTADEARQNPRANFEVVTPSYFKAIGTPLLAGRTFGEDEGESKPLAAVVSESIARAIAGTPSKALGRHFTLGNRGNGDWTIVGIVADARYRRLNQVSGNIFLSYKQSGIPLRYLIVRTRVDPSAIGSIVRHEISQIDPSQSEGDEITMQEIVNVALAQDRFHSRMLLLFGATALFLAAVGVYGVVSDSVVTRRKEIGIRMALGARPAGIVSHVLRSALLWILSGEIIGIVAATVSTIAIRSTLFEVSPVDVLSICSGCAVILIVSFIACVVPALQAASTDPSQVLRE